MIPGKPYIDSEKGAVGFVDRLYKIGKYEITQAQYLEFLNAVDPQGENTYKLSGPDEDPYKEY